MRCAHTNSTVGVHDYLQKLTCQTHFRLVYGIEAMTPMEYIMPSLYIEAFTWVEDHEALEEQLVQLMELEEDRFLARFHQ